MNEPKPRAWMRRWAFDGEKPHKVKNERGRWAYPGKFKLLPVTLAKAFPDDVPLYAAAEGVKPNCDPLTDAQIEHLAQATFRRVQDMPDDKVNGGTWDRELARAIERAHGIGVTPVDGGQR